jgi:uncharacterized phage protein (TIGR02220 family)|tara:strand:+ start:457 stop:921 length:465 start_codon:yes stop_codon:yes gene_type:complete
MNKRKYLEGTMLEHVKQLEKIASKFALTQSLPAPEVQWLIANLEKCYSDQDDTSEEIKFIIHEAILHLNKRIKTNHRTDSIITLRLVRARYNKGYRLEDFIKVIDTKVREWKGTDMAKFLRPSTLFSLGHFDEYLQQAALDGPREIVFKSRPSI